MLERVKINSWKTLACFWENNRFLPSRQDKIFTFLQTLRFLHVRGFLFSLVGGDDGGLTGNMFGKPVTAVQDRVSTCEPTKNRNIWQGVGTFPAVFVATKTGILCQNMISSLSIFDEQSQRFNVFKQHLCHGEKLDILYWKLGHFQLWKEAFHWCYNTGYFWQETTAFQCLWVERWQWQKKRYFWQDVSSPAVEYMATKPVVFNKTSACL